MRSAKLAALLAALQLSAVPSSRALQIHLHLQPSLLQQHAGRRACGRPPARSSTQAKRVRTLRVAVWVVEQGGARGGRAGEGITDEHTESAHAPTGNTTGENAASAPAPAGAWKLLNQEYAGWLLLNFVTVLWGSQHAIIKLALEDGGSDTSPAELNLFRFLLAAGVFVPAALVSSLGRGGGAARGELEAPGAAGMERGGIGDSVYAAGAELGLYTFLGYAMQSIGLQYTSASRSAFLLYLNVKLVPVFALLLYGRAVSPKTWLTVAVALAGTVLLGYDGGEPPNVGDAWSVAAAAASALFILRLEGATRAHDAAPLNAAAMSTVALLCGVWTWVADPATPSETWSPALLLHRLPSGVALQAAVYLGLITTALTSYLQAYIAYSLSLSLSLSHTHTHTHTYTHTHSLTHTHTHTHRPWGSVASRPKTQPLSTPWTLSTLPFSASFF